MTTEGSAVMADIPTMLQDLLARRLDAMTEANEVAQVAATIGRDFSLAALEQVVGATRSRDINRRTRSGGRLDEW